MNSVLLIDDEPLIVQGLKMLINWSELGLEVIGDAANGEDGLEKIKELHPNIVISDIAMDKMTGIDMLKKISEEKINTKVVLLSGYQEFDYAREAVRYGAVDYLLKPVSPEELTSLMQKIILQIKMEQSVQVLQRKDSKIEIMFKNAISEDGYQEKLKSILTETGCGLDEISGAVCISMKIVHKNKDNTEENLNLIRFEIYEYLQRWLEQRKIGGIIKKEYNTCFFLLFVNNNRIEIKKICKEISESVSREYLEETRFGIGEWTNTEGKLKFLYKTAKFAGELFYFEEQKYIDYESIEKEYTMSVDDVHEQLKQVCNQIITKFDYNSIVNGIDDCVERIGNIHYGNKNAVMNMCILMSGEIFSTLRGCGFVDESMEQAQAEFLDRIRCRTTFKSLKGLINDYYRQLFLRLKLMGVHTETADTVRIKQYIQEHFNEGITLDSIADYIGMNPSYLSVYFKKEIGKNFKVYLTELRMQEAIKLLNKTDMKSYELAEAVGYKDVKQFREKFREIYGVSPQQYRKNEGF